MTIAATPPDPAAARWTRHLTPSAALRGARWLIRLEIGIWRSLALWIARRRPGVGPGDEAFPYARQSSPAIGAWIFVSVVELPVVHLLVPWATVRTALLVLSVWGLLWMVGLLASLRVFPHVVGRDALRVRSGTHLDLPIPWSAVERVEAVRAAGAGNRTVVLTEEAGATVATVAQMGQTRVRLVLRETTVLPLPKGPTPVDAIQVYADDAQAFVAAARARVAAHTEAAERRTSLSPT